MPSSSPLPTQRLRSQSGSTATGSATADSSTATRSRRSFLSVLGTATATALAGCNVLASNDDPAPLHDGDWGSYGRNQTNTNSVPGGLPEPDDHASFTPGNWLYVPPVVHEGVVYFAAERRVVALTVEAGEQWSTDLDGEVTGAPALDADRGRLYVPTEPIRSSDGQDPSPATVTVLSLDGEVVASHRVGAERTYGVTVADGDAFVRSATACVRLEPDGTERWRQSLDPLVYDEYNLGDSTATQITPAVTDDGVYVPDRDALVKLDPASGTERWRVTVDTPYAASVVDGDTVVQTGWQEIVATDPGGEVRWRRDLHSRAAPAIDGEVYVSAGDLHELDPATGETNWQAHLPSDGTAAPVVTADTVLVPSSDVRAFRRQTGGTFGPDRERWRAASVQAWAYASPVVAAGHVFVVGPLGLEALWVRESA